MIRTNQYWILAACLLILIAGCAKQGKPDPQPLGLAAERPALDLAVPDRTLVVIKSRLDELPGVDGADAASSRRIAARALVGLMSRGRIDIWPPAADEAPSLEMLAVDRPAYLAISEPAPEPTSTLLDVGGMLVWPTLPHVTPVMRVLLPSDQPEALAADLDEYCGSDDKPPYCTYRTYVEAVDGHLAVGIMTDNMVFEKPEFALSEAGIAERVGFEDATAGLRAFADHDGRALYATLDGLRRLWTLIGLGESKKYLRASDDQSEGALRSSFMASSGLLMDAAGMARYADVAVLQRPNSSGVSDETIDVLVSGDPKAPADSTELSAPMPAIEKPFVRAIWPGPVHRKSTQAIVPARVSQSVFRFDSLGVAGLASYGAALLEAPGIWWREGLRLVLKPMVPQAKQAALFEQPGALRAPAVFGAAAGLHKNALKAGFVAGWSTEHAPATLLDFAVGWLGRLPVEAKTVESSDRTYLLVAYNIGVDELFGQVDEMPARRPHIEVDFARLDGFLESVGGREAEEMREAIGAYVDVSHLHLTTAPGAAGRAFTIRWGGPEQAYAPAALTERTGYRPEPSTWAWRRCRRQHIIEGYDLAYRRERVAPKKREELYDEAKQRVSALMQGCGDDFPDRAAQFRRGLASWDAWEGARARSKYRYSAAATAWGRACDAGFQVACTLRDEMGELDAWSHLPANIVERPVPYLPVPSGKWGYLTTFDLRLSRAGKAHVHGGILTMDDPITATDPVDAANELGARAADSCEFLGESDLLVAPDVLTPMSAMRPVVQLDRSSDCVDATLVFAASVAFDDAYEVSHLRLEELPEDMSDDERPSADATIRITRTGIEAEVDGQSLASPERCGSGAAHFCLSGEQVNLDAKLAALREALDAGKDARAELEALVGAYPFAELRAALQEASGEPPLNFVRIEVGDDVPAAVVPSLVHTVVYLPSATQSGGRYRNVRQFRGYTIEVAGSGGD